MTKLDRMKMLMAAVAALGLVAAGCGDDDGDDDDDDDMVMVDGGTDAGGDTTVMCGEATCDQVPAAILQIPACCANAETSQCGAATGEGEPLSIAELVAQLSTNAGCVGLNEPGTLTPGEDGIPGTEDDECPSLETVIGSPLQVPMQDPVDLPGCCQPSGTCGFFADFSMAIEGGPNFGCANYTTFEDSEGNQPTPGACTPPE